MEEKRIEKIEIIVHENQSNDEPFIFHSSVGIKYTVNGKKEGLFRCCEKPTLAVAEVVEAVNDMLRDIFEEGD